MKVIIVKFMSLGDMVMSTVGLQMIRNAFPDSEITLLTLDSSEPILRHDPAVNKFIIEPTNVFWPRKKLDRILPAILKWRSQRYDLAVSFHAGRGPNMLVSALNAKDHILPGHGSLTAIVSSNKDSFSPGMNHYTEVYPAIARKAIEQEGGDATGEIPRPRVVFLPEEIRSMDELLDKHKLARNNYVAIFPGGGYNPGNQITAKRYPQMGAALKMFIRLATDAHIVLLGANSDQGTVSQIKESLGQGRVVDLTGKTTVRQFAAVIQASRMLLTNDSSALHIAQAVSTPTVAVFGPTNPLEFVDPRAPVAVFSPTNAVPIFSGKYHGEDLAASRTFDEIDPVLVAEAMKNIWCQH
ncbi:MAG: glycosyltransferase family 9 protein [bacterium]|nr:glycosyltransferase family 9 protein [bacterium]